MTVKEAFENLKKLVDEGYEDVILMGISDQGDSADVAIYATVKEVTGDETMGKLIDMKIGTKYVPMYFG